MTHFKSYNAAQITNAENPEFMEYRVGLVVNSRDGEMKYFRNFNEAITEEITKELMRENFHDALFQKEVEQTRELADRYGDTTADDGTFLFTEETYFSELLDKTTLRDKIGRLLGRERSRNISVEQFTYQREREVLRQLAEKIAAHYPENFTTSDMVVETFKKGMMTGNLLEIGRLIDGTFGKGTLRKIGELDADIDAQEKFVESL